MNLADLNSEVVDDPEQELDVTKTGSALIQTRSCEASCKRIVMQKHSDMNQNQKQV
jgi:hypothetical protein